MVDFKKTEMNLYQPKTTPSIVNVPEIIFIAVDGMGNPNTCEDYIIALEILYGLSYAIKMNKIKPNGYFEYVVPPLEGFWWPKSGESMDYSVKNNFCWTSLIRQPEFVTPEVFKTAIGSLARKKPHLNASKARLMRLTEGLCVQAMHLGSYDDEPATVAAMEQYAEEQGFEIDINETRRHHEIYLSDPRKTVVEKLKTVIRHPIKKRD